MTAMHIETGSMRAPTPYQSKVFAHLSQAMMHAGAGKTFGAKLLC